MARAYSGAVGLTGSLQVISPRATLGRFVTTTGELLALMRDRLARRQRFDVHLPYGPMDWTMPRPENPGDRQHHASQK